MGPYETDADALAGPVSREVDQLRAQARLSNEHEGQAVREAQLRHLEAACAAAGVELGAFDRRILTWLAGWEPSTVQVVVGLIRRAAGQ